ncbi:MAG: hypothetical protein JRI25_23755, partial [Deltaproteobacteria bacterium]|nr:hypothetical protein [Deltaproteobacteria bacterium]
ECASGFCVASTCVERPTVSCVTEPAGQEAAFNDSFNDNEQNPELQARKLDQVLCTFSEAMDLSETPCWEIVPVPNEDPNALVPSFSLVQWPTGFGSDLGEEIILTAGYDPREPMPTCMDGLMRDDVWIDLAANGDYTITLDDLSFTYTACCGDTTEDIGDELAELVDDDGYPWVEAWWLGDRIRITGRDPSVSWTITVSGPVSDSISATGIIPGGSNPHLFDSGDGLQRTDIPLPETAEVGTSYTVTVDGISVVYVTDGTPNIGELFDGLLEAINHDNRFFGLLRAHDYLGTLRLVAQSVESSWTTVTTDFGTTPVPVTPGGAEWVTGWPCRLLGSETSYEIVFGSEPDPRDAACESLATGLGPAPYTFSFTTADTLGPRVVSTVPDGTNVGGNSAPFDTPLLVAFDEPMYTDTVEDDIALCWTETCTDTNDPHMFTLQFQWNTDESAVSIYLNPSELEDMCLEHGCDVYVTIGYVDGTSSPDHMEDAAGNDLQKDHPLSPPTQFLFHMNGEL